MKLRESVTIRLENGEELQRERCREISSWDLGVLGALLLALIDGDTATFLSFIENLGAFLR